MNVSTLRQAWDAYLAIHEGTGWYVDLVSIGSAWCRVMGADTPLTRVDASFLDTFKAKRRAEGVSPATVNRALGVFKSLCTRASDIGAPWMTDNVAQRISRVPIEKGESKGHVRYLSEGERAKLLDALGKETRAPLRRVFIIAHETGLRLGEVLALRKSDVDLVAGVIHVRRTAARRSAAGDTRTPKSGKSRQVPITSPLRLELERWTLGDDALLCATGKGAAYTVERASHEWVRLTTAANVVSFRFHDIRHDFATRSLTNGVAIDTVSKWLGHAGLAVTADRYGHLTPMRSADEAKKLGGELTAALANRAATQAGAARPGAAT